MKITLIIYVALSFFTLSPQVKAQERGEIPVYRHYGLEKESSIDSFITQYQNAWRELNAESFSALHAQDTEWTNAFARIFRGRDALNEFVDAHLFPLFSQMPSDTSSLVLHQISSRLLSKTVAVLHLYTDFGSSAKINTRRVHFHLILNKNKGSWEVVHTAIMDPRN